MIRLAAGETHRWTLGEGAPIFPPQEIKGALAVSIVVSDADSNIRRAGEIIGDIAKVVEVDGKGLVDKALILAGPGGLTAAAVATVLGKLTAVVGGVLKENHNDFVGVFAGLFTPDGSWIGKLSQNEDDASITLAEV